MERKVGEVFEHEGIIYKVHQEVQGCDGCCFSHLNLCLDLKPIRGCCTNTQRKDCRGVIFKQIKKDMETRNVKLTLEKAKEFYAKGGELKELALSVYTEYELTNTLPKTWDEYALKSPCAICYINLGLMKLKDIETYTALSKLHKLRDYYRQGWKPDYTDREVKYSIVFVYDDIHIYTNVDENKFLTFQSLKIANEFLNNFKDLIKRAGDLI